MSFYKTSRAEIIAHRSASESGFVRTASQSKTASFFQNTGTKIDIKAAIENVADTYKISKNQSDYIFVISRALTADVPNENHDCFPADELLRFDPKLGCRVFQTLNLKPNHINHRADDPTQARGVILDAHYNDINDGEGFVEILVAVDKTKDKKLAEGILKGDINSMSMGCTAEECHCSVCGHVATSSDELCPKHIRGGLKGKEFDGKKAYEKCYKVCFQEESWVDDPADPQALVSEVLGLQAQLKEAEKKHRMEDESTILILQNRIAKIEEILETFNKQALKVETKFKQKKVEDSTITDIEQESETEVKTDLGKFIEKSNTEELKPMSSAEFGVATATKNPYVKIAEGKIPSLWKDPGKAEGKVPSLWKSPGKGSGNAPALWKKAFLEKIAIDQKAKDYWTNYYKEYGTELVKDIKRKKLAGSITIEQMKVLEPKFAEVMESAGIDSIKAENVVELCEAIGNISAAKEESKGKATSKLWSDLDKKIKDKKADLEIALIGEKWILREGSKNIFSVENAFNISKEAFEGDEFGQSICKSLVEDGAEKTATEYKVSLYDATFAEPATILDGADDDIRETLREEPKKGIEEEGTDDLADVYKGDIKEEKGVAEGGQRDIVTAEKKNADMNRLQEVLDKITDIVEKDKLPAPKQEKLVNVLTELYLEPSDKKEEKKEKIETEIEEELPKESAAEVTANVLNDTIRDIADADKHQEEVKTDVVEDGMDDIKDVERESDASAVYEDGMDDLTVQKDNVIKVGSAEFEAKVAEFAESKIAEEISLFEKSYAERFKRALKVSIKRANLNLIDNELKAAMYDTLTNEFELPSGEVVPPVEGMDAHLLVEATFEKGAEKFFNGVLKESTRIMDLSEDSIMEFEADLANLNPAPIRVESYSNKKAAVENPKAKEAKESNPVFKSASSEVANNKFGFLKGVFGSYDIAKKLK